MKKAYMKPALEIECYKLDQSIAGNCKSIVNWGPGNELTGMEMCDEFKDSWEVNSIGGIGLMSVGTSFYESGSTCDCYYSSGGQGYFTS